MRLRRLWLIGIAAIALTACLALHVSVKRDSVDVPADYAPEILRISVLEALNLWAFGDKSLDIELARPDVVVDLRDEPVRTHSDGYHGSVYKVQLPLREARTIWAQLNSSGQDGRRDRANEATIHFTNGVTVHATRDSPVERRGNQIDWFGTTHNDRTLQITARLPGTIVATVATDFGVLSLSPDTGSRPPTVSFANQPHIIRVPHNRARSTDGSSFQHSGRATIKHGCDVPDRNTPPEIIPAIAFLGSDVAGNVEAWRSLATNQLDDLNKSLAISGIPAKVSLKENWLLGDYDSDLVNVIVSLRCQSELDTKAAAVAASERRLAELVERSHLRIGFFVRPFATVKCPVSAVARQDLCGEALEQEQSGSQVRVAVLAAECIHDSRSLLAHEFGHLMGAKHELLNDHRGERHNHATAVRVDDGRPVSGCIVPGDGSIRSRVAALGLPECTIRDPYTGTIDTSGFYTQKTASFSSPSSLCNKRTHHEDTQANNAMVITQRVQYMDVTREKIPFFGNVSTDSPPSTGTRPRDEDHPSDTGISARGTAHGKNLDPIMLCEPFPRRAEISCESVKDDSRFILFAHNAIEYENTEHATKIISQTSKQSNRTIVRGFASASGDNDDNLGLAMRRAKKVAREIEISRSTEEGSVAFCAYGEEFRNCFESEESSRRVQIQIAD